MVFLDEVEQLNHESQTRLLSAIKRRQVKPLGYGADKPCDLRIIASTSADLLDRKSTRLNSSHTTVSRMPSSA